MWCKYVEDCGKWTATFERRPGLIAIPGPDRLFDGYRESENKRSSDVEAEILLVRATTAKFRESADNGMSLEILFYERRWFFSIFPLVQLHTTRD